MGDPEGKGKLKRKQALQALSGYYPGDCRGVIDMLLNKDGVVDDLGKPMITPKDLGYLERWGAVKPKIPLKGRLGFSTFAQDAHSREATRLRSVLGKRERISNEVYESIVLAPQRRRDELARRQQAASSWSLSSRPTNSQSLSQSRSQPALTGATVIGGSAVAELGDGGPSFDRERNRWPARIPPMVEKASLVQSLPELKQASEPDGFNVIRGEPSSSWVPSGLEDSPRRFVNSWVPTDAALEAFEEHMRDLDTAVTEALQQED